MIKQYKPRNWQTIIELDEEQKKVDALNNPPKPQPAPSWLESVSRSDVPDWKTKTKIPYEPSSAETTPFTEYFWKSPKGKQEYLDLRNAEKAGYLPPKAGELPEPTVMRADTGGSNPIPQSYISKEEWNPPGERFLMDWVAWNYIPGGLFREPLALIGSRLPKLLTSSVTGQAVSKILDMFVGKVGGREVPIENLASQIGKTQLAKDTADALTAILKDETGSVGKIRKVKQQSTPIGDALDAIVGEVQKQKLPKAGKIIPETGTPESVAVTKRFTTKPDMSVVNTDITYLKNLDDSNLLTEWRTKKRSVLTDEVPTGGFESLGELSPSGKVAKAVFNQDLFDLQSVEEELLRRKIQIPDTYTSFSTILDTKTNKPLPKVGKLPKEGKIIPEAASATKVYYHGTPNKFSVFDISKADKTGLYGDGLYFTDSKDVARGYASGGEIKEVNLNPTKIFDVEKTLTPEELKQFPKGAWNNESSLSYYKRRPIELPTGQEVYDQMKESFYKEMKAGNTTGLPFSFDKTGQNVIDSGVSRANQLLRDAGYDAISYRGGLSTGGKEHQVLVSINPSNIEQRGIIPPEKPPVDIPKVETPPIPPEPPIPPPSSSQPPYRQRILDALEEQRKLYKKTGLIHQQELAKKFQKMEDIPAGGKEISSQLRQTLKGELGDATTPVYKFDPADEKQLFKDIDEYYIANNQQSRRLPTRDALLRLTDYPAWQVTHPGEKLKGWRPFEIQYLKDVFGEEFVKKAIENPALYRITKQMNDVYYFLRYNALLSGRANIRNFTGNLIRSMSNVVETGLAVAGEQPLKLIPGYKTSRFIGEAKYEIAGGLSGIKQGVGEFLHTWKTGERLSEATSKFEIPDRPIGGKLGYVLDIPSIGMEAGDGLFRAPLRQAALNKLAYREARKLGLKGEALVNKMDELIADPKGLAEEAEQTMISSLFREDTNFGNMIMQVRNWEVPGTGLQPAREFALFVRVPINIVGYGLARSPIAVLSPKMWINIARKDPKAADQLGRLMLGSAIAATGYMYAKEGLITGAPPPLQSSERKEWDLSGKIPYAVRIGDTWVQYSQIPLLNTPLFMAAQTYDRMTQKEVNSLVYDLWGFLLDQTFVKGMSNLLDAFTNPERYGDSFMERYVSSIVPYSGALRVGAQAIDPTVRDPQGVGEALQEGLPGLSKQVPSKLTPLGGETQRQTPVLSPVLISVTRETPLSNELDRLNISIGTIGSSIDSIPLTREEQRDYQIIAGKKTEELLSKYIESHSYKIKSDTVKDELIRSKIEDARDYARIQVVKKIPPKERKARILNGLTEQPPVMPTTPTQPSPNTKPYIIPGTEGW